MRQAADDLTTTSVAHQLQRRLKFGLLLPWQAVFEYSLERFALEIPSTTSSIQRMISSLPVPTPFIDKASSIASPVTALHQSLAFGRRNMRAFQVADPPPSHSLGCQAAYVDAVDHWKLLGRAHSQPADELTFPRLATAEQQNTVRPSNSTCLSCDVTGHLFGKAAMTCRQITTRLAAVV